MILWRCHHRSLGLLIGDIAISLILLWTLFYEQYSDKILIEIKNNLDSQIEKEETQTKQKVSTNEQYVLIASFQSPVFIMQVVFASFPFIITLLSYQHTGISEIDRSNSFNDH